jgi:uncharacterized protein YcfL
MKSFYLSVPIILLILIGCSSTYKVTYYPSKEDFYKDINSSMKNRDVNVVTVDSSFIAFEGSVIKNDTLQTVSNVQEKITLSEIRDFKYYGNGYEAHSASIWLKSGKELTMENVKIMPDSSVQFITTTNKLIPLTDIKHLSYKNHLVGLGSGIFAGITIGAAIGATGLIIRAPEDGMPSEDKWNSGSSAIFGAVCGIVTGAIVGAIIGWDMIYQFNP